jgi:signal transduction histidine kinase
LNLFRNAIEYSGKGQVDVVISAIQENNTKFWEVRVIDYGPGIPYDQREMLFERYMKGARGSGLGLSVIKSLTELFSGTVRIEDRVKGDFSKGSAFVLVFPAASPLDMV